MKGIKKMCTSATNYQSVWQRYQELEKARDEWFLKWYTYLGDSPDDCLAEPVPTPEQYKALQNVQKGEFSEVEDAIIETAEYIASKEPVSTRRDPASPSDKGPFFKLERGLKPFTLTASCSPPEMMKWLKRFRGYATASHVEEAPREVQIEVLESCMDPDLSDALGKKLDLANVTLETALEALEKYFIVLYPLFDRRWKALFETKKNGRPFTDFANGLRKRAATAELETLSHDDLLVFLLLAGCQEETTLFLDLYKVKDPTFDSIVESAVAFESAAKGAAKRVAS